MNIHEEKPRERRKERRNGGGRKNDVNGCYIHR
jgi:hypothetical protein